MSRYIPPHSRNSNKELKNNDQEWKTVDRKNQKNDSKPEKTTKPQKTNVKTQPKKEYTVEFPSLCPSMNNVIIQTNPTPAITLSTIFKNSLNFKKVKKSPRIKKGWVLLTKNGMIDSLTPEERKEEDEYFEKKMRETRMKNICREMDNRDEWRRQYDHTYLWEELLIPEPQYEDNESDIESDIDSDEYEDEISEDDIYLEDI
jgi:hypothetical protein